jgi:hypothetical protein
MKNIYLLTIICLASSCFNPQKMLDNGQPQRAIDLCLYRLSHGNKVRLDDLFVLEQAQATLLGQDTQWLNNVLAKEEPSSWPKILGYLQEVEARQQKIIVVDKALEQRGFPSAIRYLNTEVLIPEAIEKSAIYYYAAAQEDLPAARSGDRMAARRAWSNLKSCRGYLNDYKDSRQLEEEAYALGLTHIQFNLYQGNVSDQFMQRYLNDFYRSLSFPMQEDWVVVHHDPDYEGPIHFVAGMALSGFDVSLNQENQDCCISDKEVEVGVKIEKEWSKKDSCYVEVKVPVYDEVKATAITITQYKDAHVRANFFLEDTGTGSLVYENTLYGRDSWSNEYTVVSGDRRAEGEDFCPDEGGSCALYPSNHALLSGSMRSLGRVLHRHLARKLPVE